jgi:hypothetical protein
MIRGKPKIVVPNDGVNAHDAPPGYMAVLGSGNCGYYDKDNNHISCCFSCTPDCKGTAEMRCISELRLDKHVVAYVRLTQ